MRSDAEILTALEAAGGNRSEAARLLDMPRSTYRERLTKAQSSIGSNFDDLLRDEGVCKELELRAEVKVLEARNAKLLQQIQQHRESHVRPFKPASRAKQPSDKVRVAFGDLHGCFRHEDTVAALLDDLKALAPDEVIFGGDILDCAGAFARHHKISYVDQAAYTFADDVNAANEFLSAVQEACPKAVFHYLEGNHEQRLERTACEMAERCGRDADFFYDLFGPEAVLSLERRGIPYYRMCQFHGDVGHQGVIKLGKCYFTHAGSTAKHAAAATLQRYGGNVVFFHSHREDTASTRSVHRGNLRAWNPGCLCGLHPLYNMPNPSLWAHGYHVQFVAKSERFVGFNVPIIDGTSDLVPLTRRISV